MKRIAALGAIALTLVAARDDRLAGYVPGKPVTCISTFAGTGPVIVDEHTILYEESGSRIWRTQPVGACPALRPFTTIIIRKFGSQLCRNDQFQVLQPGDIIASNVCRFDRFTPYRRPEGAARR